MDSKGMVIGVNKRQLLRTISLQKIKASNNNGDNGKTMIFSKKSNFLYDASFRNNIPFQTI